MDNFSNILPLMGIIVISLGVFYLSMMVSEKKMIKALKSKNHDRAKNVSRMRVMEALWLLQKIDFEKGDLTVNLAIRKYGIGKLKWGHLYWCFEEVTSKGAVNKTSMPSIEGT